ncbi:Retinol dehydrogenase 8 [Holothuria leucospilota]|uniref:Retinol dehydrogenase 8 n=1 Tax=Holothuria leucospilota TaxID=206669 RepID=A0A9Q1H4K8_HOLLE|nr:Retinol dehydrogenase 8 [Holothuria leucospilota]
MYTMGEQKIVVITGCSSGIGLATAVLLAKTEGFKVIATVRNLQKRESLDRAAGESLNKSLFIKELDVSKEDSILKFVERAYFEDGRIDVLINNAATSHFGAFETFTMEQMHSLFQTNVFGTARLTQEVVRKMKIQRNGHIIFISSSSGFSPCPFMDFYVASKYAIEGLVGSLAPVLHPFNISVTSVQPGPVYTPLSQSIVRNEMGKFGMSRELPGMSHEDQELDKMTAAMKANFLKKMKEHFSTDIAQSAEEVAIVIKKCIEEVKPQILVQTSVTTTKLARMALTDPTGAKTMERLISLL